MRVVKIGGRAQADPSLALRVREAWDAARGELCVVHGGGDEVTALQRAMGREAVFIGGRRVTSQGDIEVLRMVLSGVVNKRLVNAFIVAGVPAIGISGEDAGLIEAEQIDQPTLGFAGKPTTINGHLIRLLVGGGYMPVVSPVGFCVGGAGGGLNVNGDDAAAAIAAALEAEELLLVADVDGVRDENGDTITTLDIDTALELVRNGIAAGGMAAKLESAVSALSSSVNRVRICSLSGLSDPASGTLITQPAGVTI